MSAVLRSTLKNVVDYVDWSITPLAQVVPKLFAAGEQGAWYDPSDFSTMFQDAAGTTPVTAVGQPVGKILDKSGRGNHASQATTANRPVLSARVNQLTFTEDFANAVWAFAGTGQKTPNYTTAPDGSLTACRVLTTTSSHFYNTASLGNISRTNTIWIKSNTGLAQIFNLDGLGGAVLTTPANTSWQKYTDTTSGTDYFQLIGANLDLSIWHPQMEIGTTATRYQRVNTSTDYDTVGFPLYLAFNGTNSSLSTAAINFTATDKMTVWAGVRKLSDAATGAIVELSTTVSTNVGSFYQAAPEDPALRFSALSRGTAGVNLNQLAATSSNAFLGPITVVATATHDIGGSVTSIRLNASPIATATGTQGTGNFGNYPLYIGARAGTASFFNGNMYGLIVRGAASTQAQLVNAEAYMNSKTGAY